MTAFLFSAWISHFITTVKERYGISWESRHLLVLDRHGSHVTLKVVQKAAFEGLNIITLPSHTSHRLQPLDVSIFKPFKAAFWACRDRWTIQNKGKAARKEELAQWVSVGLKTTLTASKIIKGFSTTGIWPLLPSAMDNYMHPSACYVEPSATQEDDEEDQMETDAVVADGKEESIPETQP